MSTLDFSFIFLGQSVLRYKVPLDIYHVINQVYETKYPQLKPANKQLVGKIEKEHSLFYSGEDTSKINYVQLLDEPYYPHQFENLQQLNINDIGYNDTVLGKDMHTIRSTIQKIPNPYKDRIPQSVRDKYEHIRF